MTPGRLECAWCKIVLRDGPAPVSHGICCPCSAKHFGKDPDDDWELLDREHEEDEYPVSMNAFTDAITYRRSMSHLDTMRCQRCGLIEHREAVDCDCEE